ncbi:hypothetical protein [Desertivirga arenae]|uniref:hypothetical protein n=1 Tax=Desertivirga arenae TaxID=2810309 RepID=UPI001A9653AF|nr:hypothetical protein [Pedobacter sp. SYSU D00823]
MNLLKLTVSAILASVALQAIGQKLPETQQNALWAASPLKADGKLDPATRFQAYNKNTRLSYSLSNDATNLYLVIQSTDVNKILMGGITFTVNAAGKKKEKDAASFTFPVVSRQTRGQRGQGGFGQRMGGQGGTVDSAAVLERRKQQLAQSREIKVLGVESIADSLISIYNEYGVKAVSRVDLHGTYIYELAIPFTLLQIDAAKSKEFAYSIKVNGRQMNIRFEGGGNREGGFGAGGFGGGGNGGGGSRQNFDPSMFEPTFFWEKYTLAKQ